MVGHGVTNDTSITSDGIVNDTKLTIKESLKNIIIDLKGLDEF